MVLEFSWFIFKTDLIIKQAIKSFYGRFPRENYCMT